MVVLVLVLVVEVEHHRTGGDDDDKRGRNNVWLVVKGWLPARCESKRTREGNIVVI